MGMIGIDVCGVEVDSVFQAEESSQLKPPASKVRELYKEGGVSLGREDWSQSFVCPWTSFYNL